MEVIIAYLLGVATPIVIGYLTYRIAKSRISSNVRDAEKVISDISSGRIGREPGARAELDRLRLVQDDGSVDFDSNLYPGGA